jgi:cytochrome c oxidase subunit 1
MIKKTAFLLYLAMLINAFMLVLMSAHHRALVMGLNPFLGLVFMALTLLIGVPLIVFAIRRLVGLLSSKGWMDPGTVFVLGAFIFMIGGLINQLFFRQTTVDIMVHDTMFVIAHTHIIIFVALLLLFFAGVYAGYPRVTGRVMNAPMGYLHLVVTLVAAYAINWPVPYEGLAGMPRRYMDYGSWIDMSSYGWMSTFAGWAAMLMICGQFLFLVNVVYSAVKGRKYRP